jgi:hypothetical protein
LDFDRREITCSNANERVSWGFYRLGTKGETCLGVFDREQGLLGREEEGLERSGADRVSEVRTAVALAETVGASFLGVRPSDGQLTRRDDLVVHDRSLVDGWCDHGISALDKQGDKRIEPAGIDDNARHQHSILVPERDQAKRLIVA